MLKRRRRLLAVSGIAVAAAVAALGTTAASAGSAKAVTAGYVTTAQAAAAPSGCVTETFTEADEPDRLTCVTDAQILLNDLWYYERDNHTDDGIYQLLTVDGSYGPDTADDVGTFQGKWFLQLDDKLGPHTWYELCAVDRDAGYTGAYWHGAGCATEAGL